MSRIIRPIAVAIAAFLLLACSKTIVVSIPPLVDLSQYRVIGVIDFAVDRTVPSNIDITHRFIATLQSSQPGSRFLELGDERAVLAEVKRSSLDLQAIKAIGSHYGVDALLTGEMLASEAKPSFSFDARNLSSASASASVEANLRGKLRETATSATAWTNGAHTKRSLGSVSLSNNGLTGNVSSRDKIYETMIDDLLRVATQDFRPTYERRKIED